MATIPALTPEQVRRIRPFATQIKVERVNRFECIVDWAGPVGMVAYTGSLDRDLEPVRLVWSIRIEGMDLSTHTVYIRKTGPA